jgi:hypothetical protein
MWPLLWSSGQSSWLQNGAVLCFLWGTNWIYICVWSSSQSSCLQNGAVLCFLWNTNWIYICVCGLVVGVPGYRTELYCVFCEVRTEFIYAWSSSQSYWLQNSAVLFSVRYELHLYMCGLVARVPGYRSRGSGLIPGATRFLRNSNNENDESPGSWCCIADDLEIWVKMSKELRLSCRRSWGFKNCSAVYHKGRICL